MRRIVAPKRETALHSSAERECYSNVNERKPDEIVYRVSTNVDALLVCLQNMDKNSLTIRCALELRNLFWTQKQQIFILKIVWNVNRLSKIVVEKIELKKHLLCFCVMKILLSCDLELECVCYENQFALCAARKIIRFWEWFSALS